MKLCKDCKKIRPLSDFYEKKYQRKRDKEQSTYHNSTCKECQMERARVRYKTNPQPYIDNSKARYDKDWDLISTQHKAYYIENRDRILKRGYDRKVRNPKKNWAWCTWRAHNRRFTLLFTKEELYNKIKNTNDCYLCGKPISWLNTKLRGDSPTLDRISNSTTLTLEEVDIAHHRCNTSKLDRSLDEFVDFCQMIIDRFKNRLL